MNCTCLFWHPLGHRENYPVLTVGIQSFSSSATCISSPAMDPHKQIFPDWVLWVLATDPLALLTLFPLPLFSGQGCRRSLDCSLCCVHQNLRNGPLVHFLKLLTPLELLHHPGIMQSFTPLQGVAPADPKPSAPESPQAYLVIPSSLDL